MLKKVYLAIKAKMKAIETRLIIHSLLLQDNKLIRHLGRYLDLPNNTTVEDDDHYQSPNSVATTPDDKKMEIDVEDEECSDLRHTAFEDEDHYSVSVIEMVKNAKEGQGKEFRLEDDIDQVADLFIRRFHHQIQLQKHHSQPLV
ncbi:hypothetical protein PHJA_002257200 [Phtheirospermum japonicum]|uniref:Uncharacterized protein n=1 Tax=Phtheirospermum japonicum TaxID=374723 RepID=A0A830CSE0_9LAMI|nr:hypothetical protein PHJA_002257200 [Phtheirospermum japonicum]